MEKNQFYLNRRTLLLASGAIAGAGVSGCTSLSTANDNQISTKRPWTAEETANVEMVTRFCDDWSRMDAEHLTTFLADDIIYQMFEGRPDIVGKDAFIKALDSFLKSMTKVEWITRYSEAIGPIVINERFDHFYAKNEKRSMHFEIAGYFLVKKGKIAVWRDFSLPGGISKIGPL
ncbi:limonene-1,2-epoxide hydrolase family protein [Oceanicoccus sp. KOV_DT_Chl]|uniref:limonene-1,2-epoxide hydrolase family protein n=1 Tax=Oceanicoccus sp. KOV_DT_Chl TaxID=1904639 RepID=UPI000C7E61AF|nr:limonene-1,2-epoxide hydrolase family protein [Oceanicoccus sp. KOV_DT_Chl]